VQQRHSAQELVLHRRTARVRKLDLAESVVVLAETFAAASKRASTASRTLIESHCIQKCNIVLPSAKLPAALSLQRVVGGGAKYFDDSLFCFGHSRDTHTLVAGALVRPLFSGREHDEAAPAPLLFAFARSGSCIFQAPAHMIHP